MFESGRSKFEKFPISRDPPEGGTQLMSKKYVECSTFPISRDPPEGGTNKKDPLRDPWRGFQFLGIPPKGEHFDRIRVTSRRNSVSNF